jgi:hypothetical protein
MRFKATHMSSGLNDASGSVAVWVPDRASGRRNRMVTGTEEYYRKRAPEYDQVYSKPERQLDLQQIKAWLPGIVGIRSRSLLMNGDIPMEPRYWA